MSTTTSTDLSTALATLEASRNRLRDVLLPPPPPPGTEQHGTFSFGHLRELWADWKLHGKVPPLLDTTIDAVSSWWHSHPWRQMGNSVVEPLSDAAAPLVRRNPWTALAVAAAVGATLAATRPWRWRFVLHQMHAVRRQAVHWAVAQAATPAAQAVVGSLLATLLARGKSPSTRQAAKTAAAKSAEAADRAADAAADSGDADDRDMADAAARAATLAADAAALHAVAGVPPAPARHHRDAA